MNIFALHPNQRKAARWHVDKHIVKMLLEYCQLLYTAHWVLHYAQLKLCKSAIQLSKVQKTLSVPESMLSAPTSNTRDEQGYRPCHVHHPSAKWTRATLGNYMWLAQLGLEVAYEYRYRFNNKEHSCEKHIKWLFENPPPQIRPYPRRGFSIAMADEYKISKDPVVCYRHFYRTSKKERGLIKYTGRHIPHWL